jgi:FHS family Na+ dependent glucose MFS transporter 1
MQFLNTEKFSVHQKGFSLNADVSIFWPPMLNLSIYHSSNHDCDGKIIAISKGGIEVEAQKKILTFSYFLSFIALGLVSGAFGPSIPSFAENTASAFNEISSLFVFSSFGYIAGSFLAGFLYNRVPGNQILVVVLILMAIGMGLLPVIQNLWLLVGLIFLIGIMQSSIDVGENTLMVWLHGNKVAPFMNGLHFSFGIGSFTAPLIIAQSLKGTQAINWAYWIIAILILIPVPFLFSLKSPVNPELRAQTSEESTRIKSPIGLFVLLILYFVFFSGAEITFANWIYTHGLKSGFVDVESAAYLTSAFWGAFMVGRFLGIGLSRRFSSHQIIWFDLIGGYLTLLVMLIFSNSAWVLWVCTTALGFFVATGFPTGMNLAGELNAVTARITSLIFVAASISVMISPWIVGQLIDGANNQVLIWVVMINLILAGIAMLGIHFWKKPAFQAAPQPSEILPRSTSTD